MRGCHHHIVARVPSAVLASVGLRLGRRAVVCVYQAGAGAGSSPSLAFQRRNVLQSVAQLFAQALLSCAAGGHQSSVLALESRRTVHRVLKASELLL